MFAVLQAAKELKTKESAEFMVDLIGVVCSPHGEQKDLQTLIKVYEDIKNNAVPEFKTKTIEYDNDGTPRLPWKQATALMFQQLAVFKKFAVGVKGV